MRARRRLVETRESERAVEALARAIMGRLQGEAEERLAKRLGWRSNQEWLPEGYLWYLGGPVKVSDFGGFSVSWEDQAPGSNLRGGFSPEDKAVVLFPDRRKVKAVMEALKGGDWDRAKMELARLMRDRLEPLIHEMTHVRDYFESEGKAFVGYSRDIEAGGRDRDFYLKLNPEVNARYSAAVVALRGLKSGLTARKWIKMVVARIDGFKQLPEAVRQRIIKRLTMEFEEETL